MGVDVVFPDEEEVIDQSEKVKKETAKRVGEMGWLFDNVHKKLGKDNMCFKCKKKFKSGTKTQIFVVNDSEPGTVIFVSVCSECCKKYETKEENIKEGENDDIA